MAALCVAMGTVIARLSTDGGVQVSLRGFVWSCLALAGVASITQLGAPPTRELGLLTLTTYTYTYTCALASVLLFIAALVTEAVTGAPALRLSKDDEFSALIFLAFGVTSVVFLLW
ncbi:hypothetical protein [Streptomyces sp. NPDC058695]|uniref:hypothetical protein n=1 Tax=Streptomyces sp. NPDC058695 TaxID=3346604 RepID=UPI003665A254